MRRYSPHSVALILIFLATGLLGGAYAGPVQVVYPNIDGLGTQSFGYRTLELALKKSGQPYVLELFSADTNHARVRAMLKAGELSVADFGTSSEFERDFLPVYLPIDRGLNGWRLLVIRDSSVGDFERVNNISDLRRYTAGQGFDWSDSAILEHAGITVIKAPTVESLFPMLHSNRFDFLPLGLNEVYGFYNRFSPLSPALTVDTHVLLAYPFARFFFVNRKNAALRDIIRNGLTRAFEDGSFYALFDNEPSFKEARDRARLNKRVVIRMDNTDLSKEFQRIPHKYFYRP